MVSHDLRQAAACRLEFVARVFAVYVSVGMSIGRGCLTVDKRT
jgi:hypothetical protein